ncbi:ATP-grasp domain-containing protein [Paenibacillus albidus]|uniref:ATP-grasp domain-containing protein n=1 Tax=Paenibacillus albidus TaxID=2041023 RepID=UPI001BE722D4|nr:ATP-grasp domain-containing protein [Paenibacillus albidus]MBT2291136.1 ATP-grasp domain-containing protein [Paenibacillus albidus]
MTISSQHKQVSTGYKILITGGRAPVALELARLLKQSGHRVFVAESVAYHLCRVSAAVEQSFQVPPPRQQPEAYLQELERLILQFQMDILIPTCEEIFYIARGLERLGSHCRVLCSERAMLRRLHHKGDFIAWAKELGLAVPETVLVTEREEWRRLLEDDVRIKGIVVLKPAYSRFAAQAIVPRKTGSAGHTNPVQGQNRYRDVYPEVSAVSPWVAQQYIQGTAICTYSVVHEGTVVAHAAYGSVYRTGNVGASVHFESLEHPRVLEWVRRFAEGTGFSGQIGFDFIEDSQGTLYPIECNPRATSGIHLFAPADGLERALLDPEQLVRSGGVIRPQSGRKVMLTLPMLACGLRRNRNFGAWKAWGKALREAEDAVCRKEDRRPFAEQLRVVYAAFRTSRQNKISITEALTDDIEWNGES